MNLINIQNWSYQPLGNEDFIHKLQHEQLARLNTELEPPETDVLKFYNDENCQNIIDIGSWTGVDSFRYFANQPFQKLIMIDAVPLFINFAKTLFESSSIDLSKVFVNSTCIVKDGEKENFKDYILADENNSFSLSGIFTSAVNPQIVDPVVLSVGEVSNVSDTLTGLKNLNLEDLFLKCTINGMEITFLRALIKKALRPKVIMFEAYTKTPEQKVVFIKLLDELRLSGYKIPDYKDILQANSFESRVIVSQNNFKIKNHYKYQGSSLTSSYKSY